MKNKVNNLLLAFSFSILLSLSAYAQRDTINNYPFRLDLLIKDSNAYPIGIKDSFVITHRQEIDTIFKIFKVYSLNLFMYHDTFCNHGNFRYYNLFCRCNEYLLRDTLIKFNIKNNNDLLCAVLFVEKESLNIFYNQHLQHFNIYPNPINNSLNIEPQSELFYQIKIYNSFGKLIFNSDKNSNNVTLNTSTYASGIYFLQIVSKSQYFSIKIIKN